MSCDQRESPGEVLLAAVGAPWTEPAVDRPDGGLQPQTEDRVRPGTRYLLIAFAVFTLLAANGLLVLGGHTERFFAWTILSRPNTSFLGAAYCAGFILSVLALSRRQWSQVRVAVVTVTAFTVLTLIPTVYHLHRLHLMAGAVIGRAAAWLWLGVYLLVPVACLVVVVRQERRSARPERTLEPMPGWLVAILHAQGAALATAGGVLWIGGVGVHAMTDMMRAPWPWPVTPLTSQVLGAWLLSFGFAIGLAIRERELSRMLVPSVAYSAFAMFELLVLLTFRTTTETDTGWLLIDAAVLATLVPTGAYGWWRARQAARRLRVGGGF